MAIRGAPAGSTATTELYLRMDERGISPSGATDLGPDSRSVTLTGTGAAPSVGSGPFGDAAYFSGSGKRYSLAGVTFSDDLTVEAWVRSTAGGAAYSVVTCMDTTGSQKNCYRLRVGNQAMAWRVYNSAGTSDELTLPIARALGTSTERWVHVRAVYVKATPSLWIFIDGQLWAYKVSTIAALPTTDIPDIQIGGEVSQSDTSLFAGYLAEVRILSAALTDTASCSPNLEPDRTERRPISLVDLKPREHAQGYTWTSASGAYYVALADMTLGAFVASSESVDSVTLITSAGVRTALTEKGNVSDVQNGGSGSDNWALDANNARIYVGRNPASYSIVEVAVRFGVANRPLVRGTRYYPGALTATGDPERRCTYPDEQIPTGGGGMMVIAAQHPTWPDGWTSEEAGAVVWTGARVFMSTLADGLPWSERIPTFAGYVDHAPTDESDQTSFQIVHELGGMHRRAVNTGLLDLDTYPHAFKDHAGTALHGVVGYGVLRVPLKCLDSRPQTIDGVTSCYKWSWAPGFQSARLRAIGSGDTAMPLNNVAVHVDLASGTVYLRVAPSSNEIWADVDGICEGAPSTAVSTGYTTLPYGDPNDLAFTADTIIKAVLTLVLGLTSSDYDGTTWDDYGSRALAWYRYDEEMSGAATLARWLITILTDSQAHLFAYPNTEARPAIWSLKDVDKSAAVQRTLRDVDILEESYPKDYGNIATRLDAAALSYWNDASGGMRKDQPGSLTLDVADKYGIHEVRWDGGVRGHLNAAQLATWLENIRGHFETPKRGKTGRLSSRALAWEQMDVIDVQSTALPTGLGNRFRAQSLAPAMDGTVAIAAFPEQPFSSSAASAAPPGRDPLKGFHKFQGDPKWGIGKAVATSGAWTPISKWTHPLQGAFGSMHSHYDHILLVRAVRSGGSADTNFQIRLKDTTNGNVIATVSTGISTTKGYFSTTTFANIPSADAMLQAEYLLGGGATGTVYEVSWWAKETTSATFTESFTTSLFQEWGYSDGVPLTGYSGSVSYLYSTDAYSVMLVNSGAVGGAGSIYGVQEQETYSPPFTAVQSVHPVTWWTSDAALVPRAVGRCAVRVQLNDAVGLEVGWLSDVISLTAQQAVNGGSIPPPAFNFTPISASGFTEILPPGNLGTPLVFLAYRLTTVGATPARIYGVGYEMRPPPAVW